MKRYRIYYMANSYTSEWYVRADSEVEAVQKFRAEKGYHLILSIEVSE